MPEGRTLKGERIAHVKGVVFSWRTTGGRSTSTSPAPPAPTRCQAKPSSSPRPGTTPASACTAAPAHVTDRPQSADNPTGGGRVSRRPTTTPRTPEPTPAAPNTPRTQHPELSKEQDKRKKRN